MTSMTQLKGTQNYIYSLQDVLGQGATGAVFKARHKVRTVNKFQFNLNYIATES